MSEATGWRPISTVPKQGEEVLLAFGCGFDTPPPLVGAYRSDAGVWLIPSTDLVITAAPTHWMPLPSPPAL